MPIDETSQLMLSIPVNDYRRSSARPLSWLRYVASTIYAGGEGDISTSHGGPAVNYDQAHMEPGTYH